MDNIAKLRTALASAEKDARLAGNLEDADTAAAIYYDLLVARADLANALRKEG